MANTITKAPYTKTGFTEVRIPPIVDRIVSQASFRNDVPHSAREYSRPIAKHQLVKIPRALAKLDLTGDGAFGWTLTEVEKALNNAGLELTYEQKAKITRELYRPHLEWIEGKVKLPKKVATETYVVNKGSGFGRVIQGSRTRGKKSTPPLFQPSHQAQRQKRLAEDARQRLILKDKYPEVFADDHIGARMADHGIFADDIKNTITHLEGAYQETSQDIDSDPALQNLRHFHQQLATFEENNPEFIKEMQAYWAPEREVWGAQQEAGFLPEAINKIQEQFHLPDLQIAKYLAPIKQRIGGAIKGWAKKTLKPITSPIKKALFKASKQAAVKIAGKLGIKALTTAAGSAIPVIGQFYAALQLAKGAIGKVADSLEKVGLGFLAKPLRKMQERLSPLKQLGKLITAPFRLMKGAIEGDQEAVHKLAMMAAAGLIAGGTALAGGVALGGAILLGSATIGAIILGPIIGGFVFLIIFIVVLIAGGAFMVTPHGMPKSGYSSAYIQVVKTASPTEGGVPKPNRISVSNPNDDNQPKIHYRVTISAPEGKLTNIQVSNDTRIIKSSGDSIQTFPIYEGQDAGSSITQLEPFPADVPAENRVINHQESLTIEYDVSLEMYKISGGVEDYSQISNAWLVDTVTVTADVPDETLEGESSSATALVEIGDAPILGPQGWPASGQISQGPYGGISHQSLNAIDLIQKDHSGSPINGCNIYTTHNGTVKFVKRNSSGESTGYGNNIQIQSLDGRWYTIYGHMQAIDGSLEVGTPVAAGQLLGTSDHTGFSTVPHLHYELVGDPGLGPDIRLYVPNGSSIVQGVISNGPHVNPNPGGQDAPPGGNCPRY
ncbi:peptidoglycan DD-metalloendopeptidase family protein [Patescibacteria group bacterium]